MKRTDIEWTDFTWNPITGCTKISRGCHNCYAERMSKRLAGRFGYPADQPFQVTLHHRRLDEPRAKTKPKRIFVCSMSDLFHSQVPEEYLNKVFQVMCETPHHTYQLLTKRHKRALELSKRLPWPDHIWLGVSVEGPNYLHRLDYLRATPAAHKFVSFEPLIERIPREVLNLDGIEFALVGAETGPGARPCDASWVQEIRDQCQADGVQVHWGIREDKKNRALLPAGSCSATFPKPEVRAAKAGECLEPRPVQRLGRCTRTLTLVKQS